MQEVVDVAAAQNPDDSNLSSWDDVLGMHYLDTTPSLFVSERVPSAMKDQDSKGAHSQIVPSQIQTMQHLRR